MLNAQKPSDAAQPSNARRRQSALAMLLTLIACGLFALTLHSHISAQDSDDDAPESETESKERENLLSEDMDFSRIAPLLADEMGMPVVWNASFSTRPLRFTGVIGAEHFDAQIGVLMRSAGHAIVVHQGIAEVCPAEQARTLAPLVGPREILKRKPYEMVRFLLTPKSGGAYAVLDLVNNQLSGAGTAVPCGAGEESLMLCDFVSSIHAIRESVDAATPVFVTGSIPMKDVAVEDEFFQERVHSLFDVRGIRFGGEDNGVYVYRVEESRAEEVAKLLNELVEMLRGETGAKGPAEDESAKPAKSGE